MENIDVKEINTEIKNLRVGKLKLLRENPKSLLKFCTRGAVGVAISLACPVAFAYFMVSRMVGVPFRSDTKEVYEHNRIEYNSEDDSLDVVSQYQSFGNDLSNVLTLYGAWEQNDYGSYSRLISQYNIDDKSIDEIKKLSIVDFNELEELESPYIQVSDSVSLEELAKDAHFEVVMYNENKDNTMTFQQTAEDDISERYDFLVMSFIASTLGTSIYLVLKQEGLYEETILEDEEYNQFNQKIKLLRKEKIDDMFFSE